MTSLTPSNAGESSVNDEITQIKMEKILLDGELLSSSLPQLEMSISPCTKTKSPRDRAGTNDKIINNSNKKGPATSPLKRESNPRTKSAVCKPTASSSIPLPITKPAKSILPVKASSQNVVKSSPSKLSRPSCSLLKASTQNMNKHTLEIQFLNKKKRLSQLQKELVEKQKPVLDLYQSLVQIKKKLEELGKSVCLDEIKLIPLTDTGAPQESQDGAGENIPPEVLTGMQSSIEDIPKTLMEICKNLLSRRNVIVDLLESIIKSEVNVGDLSDQIETLKVEGTQLQSHLDVVINEHHSKIKEIVKNWQILLNDKKNLGSTVKIEELEEKLKAQEKLGDEARQTMQELQRKLDDKRHSHDKYINDLNNVIHGLRDQVQKLENDLETEKKNASDYKLRINTNTQTSKTLRNKILELENDKKTNENLNSELNKKVKQLQEQLKQKESVWNKEKEEMAKNMKHQENMLQKMSSDKSSFETRLQEVEGERTMCEDSLEANIESLQEELNVMKNEMAEVLKEKDEAIEKCKGMENQIAKLGMKNIETMNMVTNSINWGKDCQDVSIKANEYSESMMKDIIIQELKDELKRLDDENQFNKEHIARMENYNVIPPSDTEQVVTVQHEIVLKYKHLLADSDKKLTEKSQEVSKLTSEIRQLKVRQEHLEELNQKCPAENLQKMVEEGRNKLSELIKKCLESEQKILQYETIIDKQNKQMNEMGNLLRYRENMAGVLKSSRDELIIEKESLSRYSQEMRTALTDVTKEGKMKDRLIKELQDKIDVRERQISKLEKDIRELENNLAATNERRFKLQETLGSMERDLQSTNIQSTELADTNTRYEPGMQTSSRHSNYCCKNSYVSSIEDTTTKSVSVLPNYPENASKPLSYKLQNTKTSSRSMLGLSIKQVQYLKSRLNHLTKVNALTNISSTSLKISASTRGDKTYSPHSSINVNMMCSSSSNCDKRHRFDKIVELTAKKYDYLQKQAYESYEELTNLVKLAASSHNDIIG